MIVTVTLNPALQVSYAAQQVRLGRANPVSQVSYRAGGGGLAVARVLHTFGHEVVATGLAGGASGELIRAELSRSGIATQFTQIALESRRDLRVCDSSAATVTSFSEPAPYITTEELGRLAADFRGLMDGATAVVLCGSLPAGLPTEIYGSLASYAAEAGVPAVLDAGGSALWHAVARRPALAIPRGTAAEPAALVARGARAAVAASDKDIRVVTASGRWRAWLPDREPGGTQGGGTPDRQPDAGPLRGGTPDREPGAGMLSGRGTLGAPEQLHDALVAGFVPGIALGWSWPDSLRHAVALVAAVQPTGEVDLGCYEARLPDVQVERPARLGQRPRSPCAAGRILQAGHAALQAGHAALQAPVWPSAGMGTLSRQTGTCSTAVEGSRRSRARSMAARGGARRAAAGAEPGRRPWHRSVSGVARNRIRTGSPRSTWTVPRTTRATCWAG